MIIQDKTMNPIFKGKIKKGRVTCDDKKGLISYIDLLGKKSDVVEIIIRKPKKDATVRQRKYYFGVIIKMGAESHGYTYTEMHDAYKGAYLNPIYTSLNDLNTVEMNQFIEDVIRAEAENGLIIPYPNEIEFEDEV